MDNLILEKIKNGQSIELNLSFCTKAQREIFSQYINTKIRRKFLKEKIIKLRLRINQLLMEQSDKKELKEIEEQLEISEKEYNDIKFLHFVGNERTTIYQIKKKIKKIHHTHKEIELLIEIFEQINIKLLKVNKNENNRS